MCLRAAFNNMLLAFIASPTVIIPSSAVASTGRAARSFSNSRVLLIILAFSFSIVLILAIFGGEKSNSVKPILVSFGSSKSVIISWISVNCCSNFSLEFKASKSSSDNFLIFESVPLDAFFGSKYFTLVFP